MRPPDLPGGNRQILRIHTLNKSASMRPPDLPGGNLSPKSSDGGAMMDQLQ